MNLNQIKKNQIDFIYYYYRVAVMPSVSVLHIILARYIYGIEQKAEPNLL